MAIDLDAIAEGIAKAINEPISVTTDAGTTTMHPLDKRIEALASVTDVLPVVPGTSAARKITFNRLRMGGSIVK